MKRERGRFAMGFWIFMLIMNLLIPITMVGFGRLFMIKPPKTINALYGYRTDMSMKNQDTWIFAHQFGGKIWFIWGILLIISSFMAMILVIGKTNDTVGIFGGIICGIQLLCLIGSIIQTEIALRKTFDEVGNRK